MTKTTSRKAAPGWLWFALALFVLVELWVGWLIWTRSTSRPESSQTLAPTHANPTRSETSRSPATSRPADTRPRPAQADRKLPPTRRKPPQASDRYRHLTQAKEPLVPLSQFQFSAKEKAALLARRSYLIGRVYHQKAGMAAMPQDLSMKFRGEWALVTYSMTAIALTNLAFLFPKTRRSSIRIIDTLLQRVLTPSFRAYDKKSWRGEDPLESLQGPNGHIGYLGHLNMILAARLVLGPSARYQKLFQKVSLALARKHKRNPWLIAHTYPQERYIPDHAVVMASLAWFDRLFPQHATNLPQQWLQRMLQCCVDQRTGLFVFAVSDEARPLSNSRGSGSTWNMFFLAHVNRHFVQRQFPLIKKHFLKRVLLFSGIREWPHGIDKPGDIDSGPLVMGISPSATGFAIGGARFTGDIALYRQLLATAAIGGLSTQRNGKRFYLLAPLVGEAILLATRTTYPWDLRFRSKHQRPVAPEGRKKNNQTRRGQMQGNRR